LSGEEKDMGGGQVDHIIEKCYKEISESPESVTAFLATDLLGSIIVQANRRLQDYVLRKFLLDRIIDPLISGDQLEEEDVHMSDECCGGESKTGGCCGGGGGGCGDTHD
jgi:hypothetical protein